MTDLGGGCPGCERLRDLLRLADLKLQDERQSHIRDLRAADQRAVELALTATEQRFDPVSRPAAPPTNSPQSPVNLPD